MKCFILLVVLALAKVDAEVQADPPKSQEIVDFEKNLANLQAMSAGLSDQKKLQDPAAKAAQDEYFQQLEHKRGTFYIKWHSTSKECTFAGYAPNGPIADIGKIKAPKATLDGKKGIDAVLGSAGGKLKQAATLAMHAMKLSAKLMKAVPMLGPMLGVFSAAMDIANPKPTAQDILNSVNKAVKELTDEVNKKLDQMEGYVDSKVAKAEKELIKAEYSSAFRLWSQCIEEPTKEDANECQRDAVRTLVASLPKFTPLAGELNGNIDMEKVRKLEAYMLSFRDYANLVIMEITPLMEYYCTFKDAVDLPKSPHYCEQFSNKMIKEVTFFIKYAKEAIAAIRKGHWGTNQRGNCPNTLVCNHAEKIVEGKVWGMGGVHTYDKYKCRCEIESSNTKKYCTLEASIRVDGKHPGIQKYNYRNIPNGQYKKAIDAWGKYQFDKKAKAYQDVNHQAMNKYWQQELLDFVPAWEKAVKIAEDMKKANPNTDEKKAALGSSKGSCCNCACDEEMEDDMDTFGSSMTKMQRFLRYQRRLDQAGHRYVNVEALEDQFAAEEEEARRDAAEEEEAKKDAARAEEEKPLNDEEPLKDEAHNDEEEESSNTAQAQFDQFVE